MKNIFVESENCVIRFNHVCAASSAGRIDPALLSPLLHLLPSHGRLVYLLIIMILYWFGSVFHMPLMTVSYNTEKKTNSKSY